MAQSSGPLSEPLSVGNVVSTGFRLYNTNAKQYLVIGLYAILWSLLPVLALIVIALAIGLFAGATQEPTAIAGLAVLAVVGVIVLGVFCYAKSLANSALISRLAFGELSNQSEPLADARRFVNSRKWSFLFAQLLVGLMVAGLFLAAYVIIAIFFVGMLAAVGGFAGGGSSGNSGVAIIVGLLIFALAVAAIVFFCWLSARLSAVEVPLAIESDSSAVQTISRIWELTKGSAWRVFLVLFITFCVTLPLYLLAQLISIVPRAIIAAAIPQASDTLIILQVLFALVGYAVGLLLSIIVLPLWQSIKAVIYYDLRSRSEGLGLQFRDRDLTQ